MEPPDTAWLEAPETLAAINAQLAPLTVARITVCPALENVTIVDAGAAPPADVVWGAQVTMAVDVSSDPRAASRGSIRVRPRVSNELLRADRSLVVSLLARWARLGCERLLASDDEEWVKL